MARASAKSPEAFRTISEAADVLDLPQHVLRFWETRFSQIKPMKRSGGRRYYRPSDIALLQGIRHLLYDEGYTIKGVQRILREQGIAHVVSFADQVGRLDQASPPARQPQRPPGQHTREAPSPSSAQPMPSHGQTEMARPDPVRAALSGAARHIPPTHPSPTEQSLPEHSPETQPPLMATPHAAPAPGVATPLPPVVAASPGLRFVAESEPSPTVPETPVQEAPSPQHAQAPSQPMPQPVSPAAMPPHVAVVPGAAHSAEPSAHAATTPVTASQPVPQATLPPGAAAVGAGLRPDQTEALVQALRTLMECKSQLDQARPAPASPSAPSGQSPSD